MLKWMGCVIAATVALMGGTAFAQTAKEDLAKPPADAQRFSIVSSAGTHGQGAIWTAPDGTLMARDSLLLRGQVWEMDQTVRYGADGQPASVVVRGVSPQGDVGEIFIVSNGSAAWKSQIDAGQAPYAAPALYVPAGGTFTLTNKVLIEALLASPDHSVALLPGGRARAERLTQVTVGEGALRKTVVAWSITGLSNSPQPVWATEDGKFFGFISGLAALPAGYEGALPVLEKAQNDAISARSPALVRDLLKTPAGPVAFTHVRAFIDGKTFAEDQTVVVDKGVIVAVGPAARVKVPAGAQVIDGAGKSLVPGLWDSHMHVGDDFSGPLLLAIGVTSARDPGNNNPLTIDRAARRAKGLLLLPHVYASVLIDGKGPNSAQLGSIVTSQDEAIAAVRKAKADGFIGVKFYGTFNPAWLKLAAAEAHKLGLHVHGHVPAGMRPSQAIADGYDEITHIYFVMMEAMPDDVVATSNGINRFNGTGRYSKDVDLTKGPIRALIVQMAKAKSAVDPTLVVAESLFVPENGDLSPAYAPFVGTLPPATERSFRQGGFAVPQGVTREDFRKSYRKLADLVLAMHKAGVLIVAGTDGSGLELVRELELYVEAGFTPAEALQTATINAARNVGVDGRTGSIAVGKTADLVLVEGDPSKTIGDLRHTRVVMMDGQLMDADALRAAAGFSGRPK